LIKSLQTQRQPQKIALIWDGAGYHTSDEFKEFWHQPITIISLTSGKLLVFYLHPMPRTKPGRRCLVTGENFLRKFWPLCKTFSAVKWLFKFATNHKNLIFLSYISMRLVPNSFRIAI
jgi:hypothetical protein